MPKAKPIELECPGCEENLQLDAGFAGGVCRCFRCGTLMTVPDTASGERAERLVRPARPGEAPAMRPKRPASPAAAAAGEPTAAARGRSRPESPTKRPGAPPPAEPEAKDDADTEVYTTESGRTVRVNTRRGIPTATKRRVARLTTYAVFGLVIAILVAMCGFAVYVLLNQPPPESSRALPVETFTYDPATNPFTLDKPNALGLPLRERTAIVVDASASSESWLDHVGAALGAGLTRPGGSRVELVYATATGPLALVNGMAPLAEITPERLAALHGRVAAAGEASLADGVGTTLGSGPTHLILVTSQRIDDTQAARIRELVASRPDLIFDAVAIDRESLLLEGLAEERTGRYTRLSSSQLGQWRADAETP